MDASALGAFGVAFVAGLLSILSPCVLPLLPLVLGAAAAEHRYAPALLAIGVALSFVAIGLFMATIGFAVGLDGDSLRLVAAALLIALGVILLAPELQARVAAAGGPISDRLSAAFGAGARGGMFGQFGVGLLLGAVWSPCVGPTLGAASVLAARGRGDDGRVRSRRGRAADVAWSPLAASDGALAGPAADRWETGEASARRVARPDWRVDRLRLRQDVGDGACHGFARMVDAVNDAFLALRQINTVDARDAYLAASAQDARRKQIQAKA